jgi:hypothetical protein
MNRDLHWRAAARWWGDGRISVRLSGMGGMLVFVLLGAVSCSREESLEPSAPEEVQESSDPLGIQQGQWIDLGTLQTARETKRYALQLQREPEGNLTLAFLVSTDSGFQPATDLEGAELTLLADCRSEVTRAIHHVGAPI